MHNKRPEGELELISTFDLTFDRKEVSNFIDIVLKVLELSEYFQPPCRKSLSGFLGLFYTFQPNCLLHHNYARMARSQWALKVQSRVKPANQRIIHFCNYFYRPVYFQSLPMYTLGSKLSKISIDFTSGRHAFQRKKGLKFCQNLNF